MDKALVAIAAYQTPLLVHICNQVMVLYSIGSGWQAGFSFCGVGCAVFKGQIVFVAAIVVAAHIIAVVATEALLVNRQPEGVGNHLSMGKRQVAGSATTATANSAVLVSLAVHMAT